MDLQAAGAKIDRIVDEHEIVGLAIAVVGVNGLRLFRGHGLADREMRTPINPDTVFRVASITKTFTAIAVMQLVEDGLVGLDEPADRYLRSLELVPARPGHRQPTVRELLTHTAGLGELASLTCLYRPDFGESVPVGEPVPSVAAFYGGRLHLKAEPGAGFTYGNHSPAVLGLLVEDVTGRSLATVFRERIFGPLGMAASDLLRTDAVRAHLATGYRFGRGGARVVEEREMTTAGAASVYSTPADMGRYVAALLGGGANEHGRILRPETLAEMFAPQYRPDPRVPGMGLGFWRADVAGREVVEHQGVHPGFDSHLCLAPTEGVGVIALTNGAREAMFWLSSEAEELLAVAMDGSPTRAGSAPPPTPAASAELLGWYRLRGPWSDLRKRLFMGLGAEVFQADGQLRLRFLTPIPQLLRGFPLTSADASDADVYEVDLAEAGASRIVFTRAPDGSVRSLVLGMMPLELPRQPRATNPRRWIQGALAALALAGSAGALRLLRRG
jgi:CubicO group peptidase (beta-lactamase class C family)